MRFRLGPAATEDAMPLWAWYQYAGSRRRKPDLRSGGYLPKGERGVRLELEMDERAVLLSDFDLWHYVLNDWYLPASVEDAETFAAWLAQGAEPEGPHRQAIVASWRRIFAIEWAARGIAEAKSDKAIQATFWELRLENVRQVQAFVAR